MSNASEAAVGYKRPPTKTRFRKGQSGNPSGRKKSNRTIDELIGDELSIRLAFIENGGRRKLTKLALIIKQAANHALKGDFKPLQTVLKIKDLLQPFSNNRPAKKLTEMDLSKLSNEELHSLYREIAQSSR
jgi:hypothetical protein